jgi:hypothetical protein
MSQLSRRTTIVTGGSRGIGAAVWLWSDSNTLYKTAAQSTGTLR